MQHITVKNPVHFMLTTAALAMLAMPAQAGVATAVKGTTSPTGSSGSSSSSSSCTSGSNTIYVTSCGEYTGLTTPTTLILNASISVTGTSTTPCIYIHDNCAAVTFKGNGYSITDHRGVTTSAQFVVSVNNSPGISIQNGQFNGDVTAQGGGTTGFRIWNSPSALVQNSSFSRVMIDTINTPNIQITGNTGDLSIAVSGSSGANVSGNNLFEICPYQYPSAILTGETAPIFMEDSPNFIVSNNVVGVQSPPPGVTVPRSQQSDDCIFIGSSSVAVTNTNETVTGNTCGGNFYDQLVEFGGFHTNATVTNNIAQNFAGIGVVGGWYDLGLSGSTISGNIGYNVPVLLSFFEEPLSDMNASTVVNFTNNTFSNNQLINTSTFAQAITGNFFSSTSFYWNYAAEQGFWQQNVSGNTFTSNNFGLGSYALEVDFNPTSVAASYSNNVCVASTVTGFCDGCSACVATDVGTTWSMPGCIALSGQYQGYGVRNAGAYLYSSAGSPYGTGTGCYSAATIDNYFTNVEWSGNNPDGANCITNVTMTAGSCTISGGYESAQGSFSFLWGKLASTNCTTPWGAIMATGTSVDAWNSNVRTTGRPIYPGACPVPNQLTCTNGTLTCSAGAVNPNCQASFCDVEIQVDNPLGGTIDTPPPPYTSCTKEASPYWPLGCGDGLNNPININTCLECNTCFYTNSFYKCNTSSTGLCPGGQLAVGPQNVQLSTYTNDYCYTPSSKWAPQAVAFMDCQCF